MLRENAGAPVCGRPHGLHLHVPLGSEAATQRPSSFLDSESMVSVRLSRFHPLVEVRVADDGLDRVVVLVRNVRKCEVLVANIVVVLEVTDEIPACICRVLDSSRRGGVSGAYVRRNAGQYP